MRTLFVLILCMSFGHTAFAAGGDYSSGSGSSSNTMDQPQNPFDKAYALIDSKKFAEAHQELKKIVAFDKSDNTYNLLGFTARKSGDLVSAGKYYEKALSINSRHVGALQYQGELFITLGELDNAKQNLEKIGKICWLFACEEETLLKTAIDEALDS